MSLFFLFDSECSRSGGKLQRHRLIDAGSFDSPARVPTRPAPHPPCGHPHPDVRGECGLPDCRPVFARESNDPVIDARGLGNDRFSGPGLANHWDFGDNGHVRPIICNSGDQFRGQDTDFQAETATSPNPSGILSSRHHREIAAPPLARRTRDLTKGPI